MDREMDRAEEDSLTLGRGTSCSSCGSCCTVAEQEILADARQVATSYLRQEKRSWEEETEVLRGISCFIPGLLYVGGYFASKKLEELKRLKITGVVNCCSEEIGETKGWDAVEVLNVPAKDEAGYPLLESHLPKVLDFVQKQRDRGGRVFLHCLAGVNRSATLGVAVHYLLTSSSILQSIAACAAARPGILQNPTFLDELLLLPAAKSQQLRSFT